MIQICIWWWDTGDGADVINCTQRIFNTSDQFFQGVYVQSSSVNTEKDTCTLLSINIFHSVTDEETVTAFNKLKKKVISGSSFFIKDCVIMFTKPLSLIFYFCLESIVYPNKQKVIRLCPVFKSGDKTKILNYRTIALLCKFSKVFEIILYERIYPLVGNQINLTLTIEYLLEILDKSG